MWLERSDSVQGWVPVSAISLRWICSLPVVRLGVEEGELEGHGRQSVDVSACRFTGLRKEMQVHMVARTRGETEAGVPAAADPAWAGAPTFSLLSSKSWLRFTSAVTEDSQ